MTLLTGPIEPSDTVSVKGGMCGSLNSAALDFPLFPILLDRPIEFMRDCWICGSKQQFRAGFACASGLAGYCLGCGEELVVPYTRTNAEAES